MSSCKLAWSLAAVLAIVVAVLGYKFVVGEVKPSSDGRLEVQLTRDERNALLLEMRTWLKNSQAILAAASAGDIAAVVATLIVGVSAVIARVARSSRYRCLRCAPR